ncbi:TraB/GumN family protein [Candidatus Glomeribacter gigasporarum]|uniref:TraB/GumN family protein n=1 Tax=Candidatus Glomeribacter gigasporarum TaxID=132144 RepID=UPI0002FDACBF|nr:TraB/GumN family protein [Candidatus Glomeribacter gigasporarum]
MTHKRQYGARCGRSRPPSRSDGGDPAASSDRCGRSRFRRAQRDRCDPAAIPNTEHAEAAQGKSLKNAFKRFLAALRWHFILLYGLMGLCLTSPLTPAFSYPSAPVPESAERVAPHLPFYIARKGPMTLYLLGTLHVGNASDYPRPERFRPAIRAALKASPALAFELSPDDLILSQDDVQRYGMCAYPCLRRLAPAALWRRLAQRLRDHPAEFAEIKKARPWLAAMLLDTLTALAAGLQTEYGTEAQLENIYTAGRILGLETVDEQILAFARLTSAEQLEMLRQSLMQTPERSAADIRELHLLWRAGDADALAMWQTRTTEKLAHARRIAEAVDEKTLFQRNRRFAARLLLMAEPEAPLFAAIGALHLGGSRGVLALLRQHGFDIQPG